MHVSYLITHGWTKGQSKETDKTNPKQTLGFGWQKPESSEKEDGGIGDKEILALVGEHDIATLQKCEETLPE